MAGMDSFETEDHDRPLPAQHAPALYFTPELSLLAFHERVLEQARRDETPLLERLRFLTISSTNLDEFFEVRVSALKEQATYGVGQLGADGRSPKDVLDEIAQRAHAIVEAQYKLMNDVLLPALRTHQIRVLEADEWTAEQRAWTRAYFEGAVLPLLTASALDPSHPFPNVSNKRLNYIVELSGEDAFGREAEIAIVPIPAVKSIARLVRLPEKLAGGPWDFVLLGSIIEANIDLLFPGMGVRSASQFRLTRNSDLWVDEEEVDDLLHAIAGELPRRNFGDAVRLEIDRWCPEPLAKLLLEQFELEPGDLYRTDGPVNLHRVSGLHGEVALPLLKYPSFVPGLPPRLPAEADPFAVMRAGDILLHHPYQSFVPVLELIERAARDPAVLAIKMTLYRTGEDSPIARALLDAATRGKDVTVVVELRARFDEAANIDWATKFQEAGANVAYGVVGRKTHAKILVITRKEGERLRSYVHLGTGNYHSKTATAYTDFGLLTADEALAADVHDLFRVLTGVGRLPPPRKLVSAPFALADRLEAWIDAETEAAKAGRPARIRARMNSLADPNVIAALYRAARAGVQIDLLVRGQCAIRPGLPGISEKIRVRSVVGRFLEHARIFCFHADGAEKVWLASADWLTRNIYRRIETCFPVEDPVLKQRVIDEGLALHLEDAVDGWELKPDGQWRRVTHGGPSAQATLLAKLAPDRRLGAP